MPVLDYVYYSAEMSMVQTVNVFNRNCRPRVGDILGTEIFREEGGPFLHDTDYINSTNDSTTCK